MIDDPFDEDRWWAHLFATITVSLAVGFFAGAVFTAAAGEPGVAAVLFVTAFIEAGAAVHFVRRAQGH